MSHSTPCRRRPATLLAALATALAASVVLSGCAGADVAATPTASSSPESTPAAGSSPASASPPAARVDPHTLRGPSSAQTVPEIVPIDHPQPATLPATTTDYEGKAVTVTDTSRILALDLYGTLTDTVIGLGLGGQLVGRTSSSTNPSIADLPLVTTNGHNLNAEAILALRPTVILADSTLGPPEVLDQLKDAGIPLVMFTPDRSMEGIDPMIDDVAAALGVEDDGERLAERVQTELDAARDRIADLAPPANSEPIDAAILYVRGRAGVFFILGAGSGSSDVITSLDAVDAASEAGITGTKPANAEALAALDPDVILVMADGLESTGGLDGLLARPGVAQTTAGKHRRIVDVPDGQLLSFGPNSAAALTSIARAVYAPEPAK